METLAALLRKRLKAIKSQSWEAVALAAKVEKSIPRKVVYDLDRDFRCGTIEPLVEYFRAVDEGKLSLPLFDAKRGWRVKRLRAKRKPNERLEPVDQVA